MKKIERHYEIYTNCVKGAIAVLNQAIYYIKENTEEEGIYPDTFYNLHRLRADLINQMLEK